MTLYVQHFLCTCGKPGIIIADCDTHFAGFVTKKLLDLVRQDLVAHVL